MLQRGYVVLAVGSRQFPNRKLNLLEVLRLTRRRLEQGFHRRRGASLFPRLFVERLGGSHRSPLERVDWNIPGFASLKVVHDESVRALLVAVLVRHDLIRAYLDVLVRRRIGDLLTEGPDLLPVLLHRGADGL